MSEFAMIECDVCHKTADKKSVGDAWIFRIEVVPHSAPHCFTQFHVCPNCREAYVEEVCDHLDKFIAAAMVRR